MARKSYHYCAIAQNAKPAADGESMFERYLAECGDIVAIRKPSADDRDPERYGKELAQRRDPRLATCPKCAAVIGKRNMAKLASRLQLERLEKPHSYDRSTYAIVIDGERRGYLGMENGWGKPWHVKALAENEASDGYIYRRSIMGDGCDRYDALRRDGSYTGWQTWPVWFAAKEAMAIGAFRAWEAGLLPTEAEQAEQAERKEAERVRREKEEAERAEWRAKRDAERERERLERLEAMATARHALEQLRARPDLTNVELAGLAALETLAGVAA